MSDQERYREENVLLYRYGFHLAYDPEDAAASPKDFAESGEVWQLGSGDTEEPQVFTRAEALEWIEERMDR